MNFTMDVSYDAVMVLKTCSSLQKMDAKMKSIELELKKKEEELKDANRSVDLWSPCSELTPDDHSLKKYEESIVDQNRARGAYVKYLEFYNEKLQKLGAIHATVSWGLLDNVRIVYGVDVLRFNFAIAEFLGDFKSSLKFP
jgi:hypothetical protein